MCGLWRAAGRSGLTDRGGEVSPPRRTRRRGCAGRAGCRRSPRWARTRRARPARSSPSRKKAVWSDTRRGLEHVVGDQDDGDIGGQVGDELLDLGRGDGVERRARLVHEQHLGLHRQGPGDAEPLLLAAREPHRRLVQPVLDQVPQRGVVQRGLGGVAEQGLAAHPVEAQTGDDVVEDAHGREGVGPLEDHADPAAHQLRPGVACVDVEVAELDRALDPPAGVVVEPVDGPQDGGLAAPRGADSAVTRGCGDGRG